MGNQGDINMTDKNIESAPTGETQRLIHELQVRQTEIEMQNEELRRAQAALEASRARYEDLYDFAPVGYITLNEEGVALTANLAAIALLGVARDSLVGSKLSRFIHKDDQALYYLHRRQVAESSALQGRDLRIVKPDGVSLWVRLSTLVTQTPDGAPECRIVMNDITARKQAEEALRMSAEHHRAMIHTAMDGIWLVDMQGNFLEVNEAYCRMSGYSAKELLAMRISDVEVVESAAAVAAHTQKVMTRGEDRFESRHRCKDGRICDVEVSTKYRPDQGGRLVVFLHDITERKREEEEKRQLEDHLRQAQKMESVGFLAGGVAHDFNNMLGVILGRTDLALTQVQPGQPIHADLMEIRQAARRSADITRQLLAFARKQVIMPKVLDLNGTVDSMLKILQRLIGENIQIAWQPCPDLWPVHMDPSQVDQILVNLCVNARDAIAGHGKVFIETGRSTFDADYCAAHAGFVPGDYLRLTVSDTGCGMDKETLVHLFEPFFTTKGVGKGTGLGLAMIYGVVTQNNGFINVYSEPGKGTTFNIYLPRHAGQDGLVLEDAPAPTDAHGHETILVAEDEPSILRLAVIMLKQLGYTVLAADAPEKAIQLAREHVGPVHLLVTDVVMPGMNGQALARELKALYPRIRSLFMSGYTADIIAHHGVLDKGVHFIQKPFDVKTLASKVREALDKK